MTSGGTKVKKNIETLMSGNTLHKPVRENLIYPDLGKKDATLWNFLFAGGYLTYRTITGRSIDLTIPNKEILCFFEETVLSWFDESEFEYNDMIDSLLAGDIATFKKFFADFVLVSFSSFDVGKKTSENFYHAFVLGMLAKLADQYEIRSNRESGYGRYDVMVIPKDSTKLGLIIEFKKVDTDEKETLEKAVASALQQIDAKSYETELRARGITEIRKVGIAFNGKKVLVDYRNK